MNDIAEAYRRIDLITKGVPGIPDERKQDWVERVLRADPKRLLWHVDRLMGFGGSEVGTLVCENEGMGRAMFTTARKIVMSKLLIAAPEMSNATMTIGSVMEPLVQEAFHREMAKYECHTDEAAYAAINALQSLDRNFSRVRPWLVGNPDDIVLLNGKRFLVDYKCTTEKEKEFGDAWSDNFDVFADYEYQLHDYDLILEEAGYPVDGMLLAKYVVDAQGYFSLRIGKVDFDPLKRAQILRAGDAAWMLRCRGDLPPYPEFKRVDLIAENPEASGLIPVAEQFYAYDALAKRASKIADELKETIKKEVGKYAPGQVTSLALADLLGMSLKPVLDVDRVRETFGSEVLGEAKKPGGADIDKLQSKLTELAIRCDLDPTQVIDECRGVTLDEERLDAHMREKGADPDAFRTLAVTVRIKADKELKAATETRATELIEAAFNNLSSEVGTQRADYLKRKAAKDAEKAAKPKRAKKEECAM